MKRVLLWGRLLLGAGLIGFLIYRTDLSQLQKFVVESSAPLLVLAYLIGIVDRIWMAYKWNILLRARKIILSLYEATVTYLAATFLGLFLPATLGGDAIRALAVSRSGYAVSDVASTIVVERALGILALMCMVIISILSGGVLYGGPYDTQLSGIFWSVAFGAIATVGFILLSFHSSTKERLYEIAGKLPNWLIRHKIGRVLSDSYRSYLDYKGQQSLLWTFFLFSIVENFFPIFWSYLLASAFHLQVSLLDCFIVVPSVLILRRLPLSIDGIGVHESAFVYLLALTGVPNTEGFLLGIATHILAVLLVLPGGIFYMLRGFNLGQIQKSGSR